METGNQEIPDHNHLDQFFELEEWKLNRGLDAYKRQVFQDCGLDPSTKKPSTGHYTPLLHDHGNDIYNNGLVNPWEWKEENIFGGFDGFFAPNSVILDLGSGIGLAVKEINEKFKASNVRCIGLDYRYKKQEERKKVVTDPSSLLIAADFKNFPFIDNSADRILSVQSFPSYFPPQEVAEKYMQEITRVSKVGTIWRGNTPFENEDDSDIDAWAFRHMALRNGWEFVEIGNSFIAKLLLKNNQ